MLGFEVSTSARPFPGETSSGDRSCARIGHEDALIAVIDGSGHGLEASEAAAAAAAVLERESGLRPDQLLNRCHEALRSTRGAAITLATIDRAGAQMSWAGVGNVEAVLVRGESHEGPRRETLLLRNGVVGYRFAPPRVSKTQLSPGDLLILATDGISSFFLDGIELERSPQEVADAILDRHGKTTDDALVLAVRFVEEPA